MKKSQDKKQIYQEQIFTCCFKYPVMNRNTHRNTHRHTHSNTHRNIHTHLDGAVHTYKGWNEFGRSHQSSAPAPWDPHGPEVSAHTWLWCSLSPLPPSCQHALGMGWPCQYQLQLCPRSSGHKDCTGTCPHMDTPARPEQVSFSPNFIGMPWWLTGKESACSVGDLDRSLGWEDLLEKGTATPSILAWRIPWTIQSMRSQRVRHDWVTFTSQGERKLMRRERNLCQMKQ